MSKNPLVSVIMNAHNAEQYLEEAIESVFRQTYTNWEMVFWDNGSTDGTAEMVGRYSDKRLRYFRSLKKTNLGEARNNALSMAKGEIIAFLDSDDFWYPEKLAMQVAQFVNKPDVAFVYTNYHKVLVYQGGKRVVAMAGAEPQGSVFGNFLFSYSVCISSVALAKQALDLLPSKFDENFNQIEEFDLFMRILYTQKAAYIPTVLAGYRVHENMMSLRAPENGYKEYSGLLDKFKALDSQFESRFPELARHLEIKLVKYSKAKYELLHGNANLSRNLIAANKFYDLKVFAVYIASFLPQLLIKFLHFKLLTSRGRI